MIVGVDERTVGVEVDGVRGVLADRARHCYVTEVCFGMSEGGDRLVCSELTYLAIAVVIIVPVCGADLVDNLDRCLVEGVDGRSSVSHVFCHKGFGCS